MSEQQGPPENQVDLVGYASVEELAKAKRNTDQEFQRLRQEYDALRSQAANPRPEIPQRYSNPSEELEGVGVPVRALNDYFNQRLKEVVLDPLAEMNTRQVKARQHMLSTYGQDYVKFQPEMQQYVGSDPALSETYQRMSQADPVAAEEWGYLRFSADKRKSAKPETSTASRQSVVEAQIPSSRQGDSRNGPSQEQEMVEALKKRAYETGNKADIQRFASARYKQAISKRFYETGHPG